MPEAYPLLFTDCFLTALLLPVQTEFVLHIITAFGIYPKIPVFFIALGGATVGMTVNWAIGRLIMRWVEGEPWWRGERKAAYEKSRAFFLGYGKWFLVLSLLPLAGGLLAFSAGAMKGKASMVLPIISGAHAGYYVVQIFLA